MESTGIRIRYRNRRYGVLKPTQEDQEISVGRTLNDVLFVCPTINEIFRFAMPSKLIPLSKKV